MPKVDDNFAEHFNYEIWMLVQTYDHVSKLAEPKTEVERVSANAFVEAFCIHARLLMEFFLDGRGVPFTSKYNPPLRKGKVDGWMSALNQQIAHLYPNGARYIEPTKKIGAEMRREINDWLSKELERFKELLKPEYETLVQELIPKSVDTGPAVNTTTNAMQTFISVEAKAKR